MRNEEKIRLLVVDDYETVAKSLKRILEADGYHVETANSGAEALNHFEPGKFAVVFTDFSMPEMNGHELASIIKARDPKQPIVMVTAYAEGMERETLPQIDLLLEKPCSIDALRGAVNEMIGLGKT